MQWSGRSLGERESRRGGARTRSGGACSLLNLWDAPILPYRTLFGLCFQPLAHESRRQPAFAVHRCGTSPYRFSLSLLVSLRGRI